MVRVRLVLLAVLLSAGLPRGLPAATIILVRHADRVSGMSADALLSPAGEERARQMSQVLKDAKVQRIYVTEVRRTQQTAEPIAARLHLKPIVIAKQDTDALVNQLRKAGDDETILVIGHADTLPRIIELVGGGSVPAFPDTEYDRLTVLVTGTGGKAQVLTLRYGDIAQ
jgi:broad specificity phosphatase PhoE